MKSLQSKIIVGLASIWIPFAVIAEDGNPVPAAEGDDLPTAKESTEASQGMTNENGLNPKKSLQFGVAPLALFAFSGDLAESKSSGPGFSFGLRKSGWGGDSIYYGIEEMASYVKVTEKSGDKKSSVSVGHFLLGGEVVWAITSFLEASFKLGLGAHAVNIVVEDLNNGSITGEDKITGGGYGGLGVGYHFWKNTAVQAQFYYHSAGSYTYSQMQLGIWAVL